MNPLSKCIDFMASRTRGQILFFVGLCHLIYGLVGLQDFNWDFLNYHYYNPHALWQWRYDQDIAPAQLQTFLNPLGHLPMYLVAKFFPPPFVGLFLASLHFLNFLLVFKLIDNFLLDRLDLSEKYKRLVLYTFSLWAILGAGARAQLATSFNDNLISIFFLLSLISVYKYFEKSGGWKDLLSGGFFSGFAVGLKLTGLPFVIAFLLAFIASSRKFGAIFLVSLSGIVGLSASHGWWSYVLMEKYQSPLFPFFNTIFQSPFYMTQNFSDQPFQPKSFLEFIIRPFQLIWPKDPIRSGSELFFSDSRFAILFILLSVALLLRSWRKWRPIDIFVTLAWFLGWSIWLKIFGIHRYLLFLEVFAPIVALVLLTTSLSLNQRRVALCCIVVIVCCLLTTPPGWPRMQYRKQFVSGNIPSMEPNSMVLMTGWAALSFLIPKFHKDVSFIRLSGNLRVTTTALNKRISNRIQNHSGPIYVMYRRNGKSDPNIDLFRYSKKMNESSCREITDVRATGDIFVCSVEPK